MKSFSEVEAALRRKNMGHYSLLAGCCFFSVLLISAYVTMMGSPTVLLVLPEGGDSRKQMMMIFVMAVIGCGVFTTYASGLFFRYKSREVGTFLALGSSKATLRRVLTKELGLIAVVSCGLGMLLGTPLAWLLWQGFRKLIVDSEQMGFVFNFKALIYSLAFSVFVFLMLFIMLARFLKRTNILEVINETRKSEAVRLVPKRFGWLGILLIACGILLGYSVPGFFILQLHWYAPEWLGALFYAPAIVGLYMVLLHTVVNGWRKGKSRYNSIISTSIMQFQGRQTVRNMIVVALLVAATLFGAFYTPLKTTGATYSYETRKTDYLFHYRSDQDLPQEKEIYSMAEEMGVNITDYVQVPMAILGVDGKYSVETETAMGATYERVYTELLKGNSFLSESNYTLLTGSKVDVAPGTVVTILSDEGFDEGMSQSPINLVTNAINGEVMKVTPSLTPEKDSTLFGWRILDDEDYAHMTKGLPQDWKEEVVAFNVENVEESYPFAKKLFHEIVNRSGSEAEVFDTWDPVEKLLATKNGETYRWDKENLLKNGSQFISYEDMDSSQFRMYWKYMPKFRVLDKNDYMKTTAVFLTLFIFVAILCLVAVVVILFTRSMTIAMTNRRVYEDLGKLGASKRYMYRTVKDQISRIFFAPIITGTLLISAFYAIMLFFNDGRFTHSEAAASLQCLIIIAAVLMLLYGLYRFTLARVCHSLGIVKSQES